jgi:hypothetical protein
MPNNPANCASPITGRRSSLKAHLDGLQLARLVLGHVSA